MKNLLVLGMAFSLAACAGNNVTAPSMIAFEEHSGMPSWFVNVPSEVGYNYSAGTARTPDIQLTLDMAILNAKASLADRESGKLSSNTKSYMGQKGIAEDGLLMTDVNKTVKNVVVEQDVANYQVVDSQVLVDNGQYRAYVLVKYSDQDANKAYEELDQIMELNKPEEVPVPEKIEIDVEVDLKETTNEEVEEEVSN